MWLWAIICFLLLNVSDGHKICIVGSGIGGSAVAKFLRELNPSIEIHIFEKSNRIGGRVWTIALGEPAINMNAGGSIIIKDNHYMMHFAKTLGLEVSKLPSITSAIYNGKTFIFESSGSDVADMGKLAWRYGKDLLTMQSILKEAKASFEKIYSNQEAGVAYTSPIDLLRDNGIYKYTQISLAEAMEAKGIKPKLINELMAAVNRVNYGQNTTLNAFAGMIGLMGSGNDIRVVKGGFQQICTKLLELSKAKVHLNSAVHEILKKDESFLLKLESNEENCDGVIIAAPLEQSNLTLPKSSIKIIKRQYHLTQTTFVKGTLKASFFGKKGKLPVAIFTTENPELDFSSVASYTPDRKENAIYKIFSRKALTKTFLNRAFNNPVVVKSIPWKAYPQFAPPEKFTPFVLDKNLVYLNTLESAASVMEISAISAKNAVLLFDQWLNLDTSSPKTQESEKQIEL